LTAGLIAGAFPFVNLVSRPFGGYLSDRMKNRKRVMLIYMAGIGGSFAVMGLVDSTWPVWAALAVTVVGSIFVQGGAGATFAIVPMVKRRITGQVAGMAGAYGNVGGVFYLTMLTFVDSNTFFYIIAGGGFASFLFCLLFLKEPHAAFAEEYHVSSVDDQILQEQTRHQAAVLEAVAH
jgi:NNP family nitrate/nitrite transporter-like MFS transporter